MHNFTKTELSQNDKLDLFRIFKKYNDPKLLIRLWGEVFKNTPDSIKILNCYKCNLKFMQYKYGTNSTAIYIIGKNDFDWVDSFFEMYDKYTCDEYIIKNLIE